MLIRWAEEAMGRDSNRRQSRTLRVICKADGLLVPAVNNARMVPFWGIDSAEEKSIDWVCSWGAGSRSRDSHDG